MQTTEIVAWVLGILVVVGIAVAGITALVEGGIAGLSF